MWRHRILESVGILGLFAGTLACQDGERPSTPLVIRQLFGSIADEACDSAKFVPAEPVLLSVASGKNRNLVENAFVEALQRRGVKTWLKKDPDSSGALLTVNVLADRVGFNQVRHDAVARTVRTEVEVRAEYRDERPVKLLGVFRRELRDTVSQQEADHYALGVGSVADEESTTFQRLVGPLIVLATGIIVVYLFFTVRS